MFNKKKPTAAQREWAALEREEARFLKKQASAGGTLLNQKLDQIVPAKLKTTLDAAFYKAFQAVFEKGTVLIEKTYDKEKKKYTFKVNSYAAGLKESKSNLRAFSRQANAARNKNLLISGVEGITTGIAGIGIPDIPLFTAVILKTIYEIALSYGYGYDTEAEQYFILKVIEAALLHGDDLALADSELNRWPEDSDASVTDLESQIRRTANALSDELLYMKFIQGLPVVGVIGGLADSVYLKKIGDYAVMKYKRRFLKKFL